MAKKVAYQRGMEVSVLLLAPNLCVVDAHGHVIFSVNVEEEGERCRELVKSFIEKNELVVGENTKATFPWLRKGDNE